MLLMKHLFPISSLAAVFILLTSATAFAGPETWQGGAGNWNSTNWGPTGGPAGSTAPGATSGTANTDTATFNTSSAGTVTVDSGRNLQNITFDGSAGAFTLSGGALLLTSGGAVTLGTTGTSFTGTNTTETIGTPITLEGSYSFTNNSTTSTDILSFNSTATITNASGVVGTLTLGGANTGNNQIAGIISNGASSGTLSLIQSGTGTWILSGANTYTGATSINSGIINYQNATAFGKNSAITVASGATAQVQGTIASTGTTNLTVSGTGASGATGALENVSGTNSASMPIVLGANATISSDAGALTLSGGVTGAYNLTLASQSSGNGTLTLSTGSVNNTGTITNNGAGTGTTTISAVIGNLVTGVTQNSMSSGLNLSGVNTFTNNGTTTSGLTIDAGTVTASTSASALGAGGVTLGNATGSSAATLLVSTNGLTYSNPIVLATNSNAPTLTLGNTGSAISTTFTGGVTGSNNLTIDENATSGVRAQRRSAASSVPLSPASPKTAPPRFCLSPARTPLAAD